MTVTSNPWTVKLISPFQSGPLITMSTVSGTMGAADAVYSLTADIPDFNGARLKANVQLRDRFGTVNQEDGTASFFAQFLTDSQREQIMHSSERTVSNYLGTTADPMSCQGSYYYSIPLLYVEQFTIIRDDSLLSSGTKGLMWMDYVVQSYDQEIYVDKNTIKYEGLATVSGTLGSVAMTGQAFVEIQPVGHLK